MGSSAERSTTSSSRPRDGGGWRSGRWRGARGCLGALEERASGVSARAESIRQRQAMADANVRAHAVLGCSVGDSRSRRAGTKLTLESVSRHVLLCVHTAVRHRTQNSEHTRYSRAVIKLEALCRVHRVCLQCRSAVRVPGTKAREPASCQLLSRTAVRGHCRVVRALWTGMWSGHRGLVAHVSSSEYSVQL